MHLRDGLQTHATVRQRYDHLVETGAIARDAEQERIAGALDRLTDEISAKRLAQKSSALGWLFARKKQPHMAERRGEFFGFNHNLILLFLPHTRLAMAFS